MQILTSCVNSISISMVKGGRGVKDDRRKKKGNEHLGFESLLMHGGERGPSPDHALNPPIFMTSTFTFDNTEHVRQVMNFESDDYVYTRGNNPTLRLFENRMANLENGKGAVAFASGMAAISSVLFSMLKPGDKVLGHKTLYGSSHTVLKSLLPRYNVEAEIIDLSDYDLLQMKLVEGVEVVYFETPCNPTLQILDIKAISELAHKFGAKVVVDNTFATPYLQKPLDLGADVVVHSATKYIGGHGDVVAGVAIASDPDYIMSLKFEYMCEFGGAMSPFNAWLLLRGLKTLAVRMRQHQRNAMEVAAFLEAHPLVEKVYYPGLHGHPDHELAKEQMSGFGAMISFEVKGGIEAAKNMVNSVELAQLAVSLGDCETLIEVPAAMTHLGYDRASLEAFGLTESMVRLSIGIEDVSDIIFDLKQALDQA